MSSSKSGKVRCYLAVILLGATLAVTQVDGVSALANTQVFPSASYLFKDPNYGPTSASMWGSNYNQCCGQIVEAGLYTLQWDQTRANNIANDFADFGPVVHLFQYNPSDPSNNCSAPFSYSGAMETNLPNPWFVDKNADCSPFGSAYHNETRFLTSTSNAPGMVGGTWYGGAGFNLNTGELVSNNTWKVSNDICYLHTGGSFAHKVPLATWCFNGTSGSGNMYQC